MRFFDDTGYTTHSLCAMALTWFFCLVIQNSTLPVCIAAHIHERRDEQDQVQTIVFGERNMILDRNLSVRDESRHRIH